MPNYDLLELRDSKKLQDLKNIWESSKEHIEKDLWVIRNFLTTEELEWLNKEANGNRHTLYGRCWQDLDNSFLSSREDC